MIYTFKSGVPTTSRSEVNLNICLGIGAPVALQSTIFYGRSDGQGFNNGWHSIRSSLWREEELSAVRSFWTGHASLLGHHLSRRK